MNIGAILSLISGPYGGLLMKVPEVLTLFQKQPPKDGHKTTEFWLTTAISAYALLAPAVPPNIAVIIVTALVSVYTISRAIIKAAHSFGGLPGVDDLPDLTPEQQKLLNVAPTPKP